MKMLALPLLLCAVVTLAGAAGEKKTCPDKWTRIKGRCFLYVQTPLTWTEAEKNCVSVGGHLASIHSAQEYQDIQSLVWCKTQDYKQTWIGGSDAQKEGVWTWTDDTPLKFFSWCTGEPNNGDGKNQDCLQINYSEKRCWDDQTCSVKLPSVCAK